ncbi:hypothetical protein [Luteimicrobium subarcticum]|uniref:Uncharacterized protein n=1 Tax=Luteimicrobium subarcticum TaxID=620910 RepID=A0A2M8W3N2_9MICO|nr:hypothetical protein [Luteimicrobium subarcticum]PJI85510.1 hypothetical protein CLV34_3024 [Luteimicrobium subarcticum]
MTPVDSPAARPAPPGPVGTPLTLVVPAGTDVLALARAWFPDAGWVVHPAEAAAARTVRRTGGARFRGAPVDQEVVVPRFRLADGAEVDGPLPAGPGVPAIVGVPSDAYRVPADPLARAWASAAARHVGGSTAVGSAPPHPEVSEASLARLVLFAPSPVDAETAGAWVRSVLPAARTHAEDATSTTFSIRHDLAYDGTIVVEARPATGQMPPALRALDWRAFGPHTVTVGWVPADHDPVRALEPTDLLCLRRAAPWIARTMQTVQAALEGAVLDADGFVVDPGTLSRLGRAR